MANTLGMAARLAGNSLRFGWYYGINWVLDREAKRLGTRPRYSPERPVPSRQELLADLGRLFVEDAARVRDGTYPADEALPGGLGDYAARLRLMISDLPSALERRASHDAASARAQPEADGLPEYYTQDFHFQAGGYLSADSARLYDVQVETLFYGSAAAMRRAGLAQVARFLRGRDQRQAALLDVACGTGRFLRQVRLAFPALKLTGLDLSRPYIEEAARHMQGLRRAELIVGNAESIPLPDSSQDVVTCIFLFHELPPEVRRTVTAEIARVLKPGGLLVFIDSLQMGDKPGWDGLLEAFPVRFHEPYFRHYAIDDLDAMFAGDGLAAESTSLAFLSKVMARRKLEPRPTSD
ncbi:MAG: methyltransferase domain-containing protein [Hyphomicrobiaceae bacterium]|nr:methyltransferase domain-containing protein [Hyphomicrobiaceae bacterium]